ncbi:MAG: hypothetical protein HDR53_05175 [Treponema sp.]|nr:hypothetical protein [Treponema sp.]
MKRDTYSSYFLELNTDGTARAIYVDDDDEGNVTETVRSKYKYSYDGKNKTITMILEKNYYRDFFVEEEGQLLTYGDLYAKVDKDITVEKLRQYNRKYYKENKDDKDFKEDYPDCNSYEDFEKAIVKELKEMGFDSFDAYVESIKQSQKNELKVIFGAKISYAYELEGAKMILIEKFTGLKNMVKSECRFDNESSYGYIDYYDASIRLDDDRYYGFVDTDKKIISFESEENGEKVEAIYTENISDETVTIKFKDKDYICKFEGDKYIQVE